MPRGLRRVRRIQGPRAHGGAGDRGGIALEPGRALPPPRPGDTSPSPAPGSAPVGADQRDRARRRNAPLAATYFGRALAEYRATQQRDPTNFEALNRYALSSGSGAMAKHRAPCRRARDWSRATRGVERPPAIAIVEAKGASRERRTTPGSPAAPPDPAVKMHPDEPAAFGFAWPSPGRPRGPARSMRAESVFNRRWRPPARVLGPCSWPRPGPTRPSRCSSPDTAMCRSTHRSTQCGGCSARRTSVPRRRRSGRCGTESRARAAQAPTRPRGR